MKAGNIADSPTLQPIAKEIADSCGGLPLAIVTIASYLKVENDEIVWKDALSALRNPTANEVEDPLPSVIKSLRFSYDHLGGEGIKLFVLFWCLIKVLDLIQYGTGERLLKMDGSFEDTIKRVRGLAKLEILQLKQCQIAELTKGLTGGWGNLKLLDLSYNHTLKRVAPKEKEMEAMLIFRRGIIKSLDSFACQRRLFLRYAVIPLPDWIKVLVSKTEEMCASDCQNLKDLFQLYSGGLTFDNPASVVEDKAVQNALRRLKSLRIEYCGQLTDTLLNPHLMQQMCNLEALKLLKCGELIHVFDIEELARRGPRDALLSRLTELVFTNLHSLKSIWKGKDVPVGSINSLRVLKISGCHCLKYVFTSKMVQHLVKLEELVVGDCNGLEEIVCMDSGNNQMITVDKGVLPLIKIFHLLASYKLTEIYKGRMTFDWPLLEDLLVVGTPNLKRLPFGFQSAPNLKKFLGGDQEWFDQLE
ncbi:hypothetical protein MRB53_019745 [Persea americana]|uniref:Uncharacterized protein n=1 Tax=Persea americana TaxID=3435 RepID=A0ACC2KZL2_PERAE|nr:hypothetical protein MRB53_019745 [Persea americana]